MGSLLGYHKGKGVCNRERYGYFGLIMLDKFVKYCYLKLCMLLHILRLLCNIILTC